VAGGRPCARPLLGRTLSQGRSIARRALRPPPLGPAAPRRAFVPTMTLDPLAPAPGPRTRAPAPTLHPGETP